MRIDVKTNTGSHVETININFFGYGQEEFRKELVIGLIQLKDNAYQVTNPEILFAQLQGRLSKESIGKLAYYLLMKSGYTIQLYTW